MFDQMLIFAPPILSSSQKSQLNDELKNGSKVEHTELIVGKNPEKSAI